MSKINTNAMAQSFANFNAAGGPAFPATWELPGGGSIACPGMTLRDWFAGRAMQALALHTFEAARAENEPPAEAARVLAVSAYKIADAMLAERAKGGGA